MTDEDGVTSDKEPPDIEPEIPEDEWGPGQEWCDDCGVPHAPGVHYDYGDALDRHR